MHRNLFSNLLKDLDTKIVLLSGPRQVGKTTLSKSLFPEFEYLNFDNSGDQKILREKTWDRKLPLVIFDELHKMKKWKTWIKGIYDVEGVPPRYLVTGSARMDIFKKGGDSLAGRHFSYRLHPFSVAELKNIFSNHEALSRILKFGGFPEPFLKDSEIFYNRWRKTHLERIVHEDLLYLEQVRDLRGLEHLIGLLSERVGSSISFSSLGRDLEVSPHTVKHWIQILESLYIIFVVPPYSKNIARALLKEPKIYFYDTGRVKNELAMRLENAVASALLKDLHFRQDTLGETNGLFYIRDKEKREVDFLTLREKKIHHLIEVKSADSTFSPALLRFTDQLKPTHSLQLVHQLPRAKSTPATRMIAVADFLSTLEAE